MNLPPGPINYNAGIGLTWRHAFRLWWDPLVFVRELAKEYGDVVFYRLFGYEAYQIYHPDLVREILVTQAKSFIRSERQMGIIKSYVGEGVLTSEGEFWRRQRRIVQPAFAMKAIERMTRIQVEEAAVLLDRWREGAEVHIHVEMIRLTIRAVSRALFGRLTEGAEAELAQAIVKLSESSFGEVSSPIKLPDWLPLPLMLRIKAAKAYVQKYVGETIARRRAAGEAGDDLLGMLLTSVDDQGDGKGMTDQQAYNEALSMFFAGHHTTAACLCWTLYLLATHPQWMRRVRGEAQAVLGERLPTMADMGELPIAMMVLKESMRMYPPAWSLFCREAVEEVELGGYTISKGGWCFMYPWVLQVDPRFFPEPEKFDPERFSPQREKLIPTGAYVPFGLGAHSCIGQKMAMVTMEQMLPLLVRRMDYHLAPGQGEPEPEPTVSLRPKGDIRLIVEPIPARSESSWTATR
jgi:cytochrome P450